MDISKIRSRIRKIIGKHEMVTCRHKGVTYYRIPNDRFSQVKKELFQFLDEVLPRGKKDQWVKPADIKNSVDGTEVLIFGADETWIQVATIFATFNL